MTFIILLRVLLFFCLLRLAESAVGQTVLSNGLGHHEEDKIISPEFSRFIDEVRKEANITGLTMAVVRRNGQADFGAWGDKTEDGVPMTTDTLFYIASCSKAFMATSLGILMDDYANGRNVTPLPPSVQEFTWDTKVKDMLPDEWELMDKWASEKANFRDILSHTSGLPRHDHSYGPFDTPKSLVHHLRYLRPGYELREKWSYNNQMFVVGAHVVSTYAGSYIDFVRDRIFRPLNMSSSTYSLSQAENSGKSTQAWSETGRRIPLWLDDDMLQLKAGPGGVISSVEDLANWVIMLLNGGVDPSNNATVIPSAVFGEVTTAHAVVLGKPASPKFSISGYGLGWVRLTYAGHEYLYHNGAVPGFSSLIALTTDSENDLGLVLLANGAEKDPALMKVMRYAITELTSDGAQVGDHIDDDDNLFALGSFRPTRVPRKKQNSRIDLKNYTGTYSNPGYGAFTLCDSSSDSFYCSSVLHDFTKVDSVAPPSNNSQLLGEWPRIWSTHIRMEHLEDTRFLVSFTALFPAGYGADSKPFETYESGSECFAEFELVDGKAIGFGLFQTIGTHFSREKTGMTVEEKAEVWFTRV